MNNFIELNKSGIEVGAAAGFSKFFTKNKHFQITFVYWEKILRTKEKPKLS